MMIVLESTTFSWLFVPQKPLQVLNLMALSPVNWIISLIWLASPIALLCGVVLKFRQSLKHLDNPKTTRENLQYLMIFAIAGIIIAFPVGWAIARLAMP